MVRLINTILILAATYTCEASQTFNEGVAEYCESFNPKVWQSLGNDAGIQEIFIEVLAKQHSSVKNTELLAIIEEVRKKHSGFSGFYTLTKNKIESHIGKPWNCLYFDDFFIEKKSVVSLSVGKTEEEVIDIYDENMLIIVIPDEGNVLVDNSPLVSNDPAIIGKAISSKVKGRDVEKIRFIVYALDNSNGQLLTSVLDILSGLGINNIGLIRD